MDSQTAANNYSLEYYLSLKYLVNVYPESTGFTVMIHELPGCMSQGDTLDEAMTNLEKAKNLWLRTVYASNVTAIPLPSKSFARELAEIV